jgi:hypothetical protein
MSSKAQQINKLALNATAPLENLAHSAGKPWPGAACR